MERRKDDGCPCEASCAYHADCGACKAAHGSAGTKTACEKLGVPSLAERDIRAKILEYRLLDFTPCAG